MLAGWKKMGGRQSGEKSEKSEKGQKSEKKEEGEGEGSKASPVLESSRGSSASSTGSNSSSTGSSASSTGSSASSSGSTTSSTGSTTSSSGSTASRAPAQGGGLGDLVAVQRQGALAGWGGWRGGLRLWQLWTTKPFYPVLTSSQVGAKAGVED